MIKKLDNNSKDFYQYMGKVFGSRLIERQTNDRIYDDDDKQWYIYIEEEKILAFVSISQKSIKNIYATKEKYLKEVLESVKKDGRILPSTVTNIYEEIYLKCGFEIKKDNNYKNFVVISYKG